MLRSQVIAARQEGVSYADILARYGVQPGTACAWWRRYLAQGDAMIRADRRGRPPGSGMKLDAKQCGRIRRLIRDRMPDQLKLEFALWTRHAVQRLIESEYDIVLPIRTVGLYLARWGYTPQRLAKRAYEQCSRAVQRWLDEDYPLIAARAAAENAEIHWGDETGLRRDHQAGRSYAERGKTPVMRIRAKRVRVQMISTVTNRGTMRFMHFTGAMNSDLLIQFFKRLIRDTERKVFVMLDNLKVHHSKKVTAWVADHREQIEVFYLPAYSSERNPDEYLNGDLKQRIHSQPPAKDAADLTRKTRSCLRSIQRQPALVRSYFQNAFVTYAA
ncbi:transposase [Salinisphaera hydrothermalis EPR70]